MRVFGGWLDRGHPGRRAPLGLRWLSVWVVAALATIALGAAGLIEMLPAARASAPDTLNQRIVDPSYINPSADPGDWNRLIGSTRGKVGLAVANVANGPGTSPDQAWTAVIDREHATGTKVVGYVDTGYFGTTGLLTRSGSSASVDWTNQVEQDVNTWYSLYGSDIDGIFLDEGQSACGPSSGSNAWAALYGQVDAYVKRNYTGAITVLNPGQAVPQCYEDTADLLVTFEGSYDSYVNQYSALAWKPVDASKICHIIYDASSPADLDNTISLSKSRDAGYVYVTDVGSLNPYDRLPASSYWSEEEGMVGPGQ